jgi:hypothetical protein
MSFSKVESCIIVEHTTGLMVSEQFQKLIDVIVLDGVTVFDATVVLSTIYKVDDADEIRREARENKEKKG